MNRIGTKWTDDEEKKLVDGLQHGYTFEQLSTRHQRSLKAIEMRVANLVKKASATMSTKDMAVFFRLSDNKIQEFLEQDLTSSSSSSSDLYQKIHDIQTRLTAIEHLLEKIYRRTKSSHKS